MTPSDDSIRRTTIAARRSALDTLEAEARRRGVSLTAILAEAVEEKARSLRAARRPQVAVARSSDGLSAAAVTSEPVADPPS